MSSDLRTINDGFRTSLDEDLFDPEEELQQHGASAVSSGRSIKKLSLEEYKANKKAIESWKVMVLSPEIPESAKCLAQRNLYKLQLANLRSNYATIYERAAKHKAEIEKIQSQLSKKQLPATMPMSDPSRDPRIPFELQKAREEIASLQLALKVSQQAFNNVKADLERVCAELQQSYKGHELEISKWKKDISRLEKALEEKDKTLEQTARDKRKFSDMDENSTKQLATAQRELKSQKELTKYLSDENIKETDKRLALEEKVRKLEERVGDLEASNTSYKRQLKELQPPLPPGPPPSVSPHS